MLRDEPNDAPLRDDEYPDEDAADDDFDSDSDDAELLPCPHCGEEVYEDAEQCPYCGDYIVRRNHPLAGRSLVFAALGILGVVALLYVLIFA